MEQNIRRKLQEENIKYFTDDGEVTFSTAIIEAIKLIPAQAKKILDVGCGTGTGKLLADKLKPEIEEYHGIEFHKSAVPIAKRHIRYFMEKDIESLDYNAYPEHYFDVIMFNDVLEHLVYPEITLKLFLNFLKNDGQVIISLPNVSHQSVILNIILNGLWEDQGVAVKEHLHFFTLSEIKALLRTFGLYQDADIIGLCTDPEPAIRAIYKAARPWMKIPYKQAIIESNLVGYILRAGFRETAESFEIIQIPNTIHQLEK